MEILKTIIGSLLYVISVISGAFVVAWHTPKNKLFVLKAICGLVTATAVDAVAKYFFFNVFHGGDVSIYLFMATVTFAVFVLVCVSVRLCFSCNFWTAMFCGTAGYCMQHISYKLYQIFTSFLGMADVHFSDYGGYAVQLAFALGLYALFWFLFLRKTKYDADMRQNNLYIIITLAVVAITIYFNALKSPLLGHVSVEGDIFINVMILLSTLLALFIEFNVMLRNRTETELNTMRQILSQEREQYNIEKTVIDTINVKCHDLKHQLSAFGGKLDGEELQKITASVDVYDSVFKTDNRALDVVLTMKSLICENKGIAFTCLADGALLNVLTDTDVYSLFGNILDNAIEAVDGLAERDKKIISLTVGEEKGYVVIHEKNYFDNEISFVDGLPQTTKEDKKYHGFGTASIKMITEKYGGDLKIIADGDTFTLDIILPKA